MAELAPRKINVELNVNGRKRKVKAYPMARLLDVLREDLRLTGTKEGCGEGECGACSVMIDGELVNSCLVPVVQATSAKIMTIESVAKNDRLSALQKAFIDCGGAQCGICTPGMIMAAMNLIKRRSKHTEKELREGLAGNLCRCTGYVRIFNSVKKACKAKGARA
jgi:aerobic carbon-monoxide dehydrogenase small subunit